MTWRRSCSPVHAGRSLWGTTRCLCLLRSFGAALCREALSGLLHEEGPATRLDSVPPPPPPPSTTSVGRDGSGAGAVPALVAPVVRFTSGE